MTATECIGTRHLSRNWPAFDSQQHLLALNRCHPKTKGGRNASPRQATHWISSPAYFRSRTRDKLRNRSNVPPKAATAARPIHSVRRCRCSTSISTGPAVSSQKINVPAWNRPKTNCEACSADRGKGGQPPFKERPGLRRDPGDDLNRCSGDKGAPCDVDLVARRTTARRSILTAATRF